MKSRHRSGTSSVLLSLVLVLLTALPPAAVFAAPAAAPRSAVASTVSSLPVATALTSPVVAAVLGNLPRPGVGPAGGSWQAADHRGEARANGTLPAAPTAQTQPPARPPQNKQPPAPRPQIVRPDKGAVFSAAGDRVALAFAAGSVPAPLALRFESLAAANLPANFALLSPVVAIYGRWLTAEQAGRLAQADAAAAEDEIDAAPAVVGFDPDAADPTAGIAHRGKPQPVPARYWATVTFALPAASSAAANVAIARLAPGSQKWQPLPTEFQDGRAIAQTDRLGDFALIENRALAASAKSVADEIAAAEIVVDDLDSGFEQFQYGPDYGWLWWDAACGAAGCWAGHAYYTWNRSPEEWPPLDTAWNWATWTPTLPGPGFYKVEVFIPGADATTTGANYQVYHNGQVDSVGVNQLTTSAAWKNIGAFEFSGSGGEYVYLSDVVPEQTWGGAQIGFDAIRFSFCADPAACQPDLEPPVIHTLDRWLNGQGAALFRTKVTDNVKVAEVVLIFNGVSLTMSPIGDDLYEVAVPIPPAQISGVQVVATDTSGNSAVFPPGQLINIRAYLSRGLGGANLICNNVGSCDQPPNASAGDPVNTAYGNFYQLVSLLTVPGPGDSDIELALSYNSLAGEPVGTIQYTVENGTLVETPYDVHVEPFGAGWTFSLGPSLLILDNTLFTGVQVRYPDGRTVNFAAVGGGYVPDDTRVYDTLVADGGGYLLKRKDLTQYRFNGDGRLTQLADRNGNTIDLSYNGDRLVGATNSTGRTVSFSYDADGQVTGIDAPEGRHLGFAYTDKLLTAITGGDGSVTHYQYDASKRLTAIITPLGHPKLQLAYDSLGRVISQIEGATAQTAIAYDDVAHTTTMTDAPGHTTTHVYDDKHRLVESRDALGASERFGYNPADQRTSFQDRLGRSWSYSYDTLGNRLTEDGPLAWHREWQYDPTFGLVTYQKDPLGRETRWLYDAKGNLQKIVNPDAAESTIVVDGRGLPTSVKDFDGNLTTLTYDPATGDLLSVTDPTGHAMSYTYDASGRVRTMTDFDGQPYRYTYDGSDRLTDVDGPLGYHVGYRFDANGNLVKEIDPNGGEIDYVYDASENRTHIYNQLDFETVLTYDAMNHLASERDPELNLTIYERDAVYRVTAVHAPEGATTRLEYDAVDNVVQTIDPEGRIRFDAFDALNRRTSSTANYVAAAPVTPDRNVTSTWTYDLAGNVLEHRDGNGNPTQYEYDTLNRKIREQNAENEVTQSQYSHMGDLTRTVDPRGSPTSFGYDENGRLTGRTDALGQTTQYAYDGNGNLVDLTNAQGVVAHHEYDALNHRVATYENYRPYMTPDGTVNVTTRFGWDLAGNRTSVTDPNGNRTEYTFDAASRLIRIKDAAGLIYAPYDYDKVGNKTAVRDPNGNATLYEFDGLNRPVSKTDAESHRAEYRYDLAGNRLEVTTVRAPGNTTTFTVYDKLNRPIQVTDPEGNVATSTYDAAGALKSVTDPEQHVTRYTHDKIYRPLTRADSLGNTWTYRYDGAGNPILVTDPNGNSTSYTFDAVSQLILEQDALGGETHHLYDAVGNETGLTAPNRVITHTEYDPLSRLVLRTRNFQLGVPAGPAANVTDLYTYDAASNLVKEVDAVGAMTEHRYDALNRRVETIDAEQGETVFGYDPVGNLTSLRNPRQYTTWFEYFKDDQLKLVRDAKGSEFKFAYDEAHDLVRSQDPYGVVTLSEFDKASRLIATVRNYRPGQPVDSQTNVRTAYLYYRDGLLKTLTNPRGFATNYAWDAAHRLTGEIDAQSGVTHRDYDRMDHVTRLVDANGNPTTYGYDALYRVTSETDAEGHAESHQYDAVGNQTLLTNARRFATITAYDALDRPVQITDALNGKVTNVYDAVGNLLQRVDQNGHADTYTYDRLGRTLAHVDAESNQTSWRYDPNGNVDLLTDGNGHQAQFSYDELDRLSSMTNAEAETARYYYDRLGNQTDLVEADGVVTRYEYDYLYRLSAVVLNYKPLMQPGADVNVRYAYAYDSNGNAVTITDPLGSAVPPIVRTTRFSADSLDRLETEVNPLGDQWQYTYDKVGNLKSRLDANNALTVYSYYRDNLLKETVYPDGTKTARQYDPNHNLTAMSDPLGASSWELDALDRMKVARDALGRTLKYAYDPAGNTTALTYPDGRTVAYGYFKNNWLQTVTDPLAGVTTYRRDGVGLVTVAANPNDTVAELSYDKADRLLSLVNRQTAGAKKTISAFAYTLDDVGQRVKIAAEYGWRNPAKVSTAYAYDPLRRLTRSEDNEGAWTAYTFDAAGNRLVLETNDDELSPKPFDGKSELSSYNDANELLTVLSDTKVNGAKPSRATNVAQALAAFRHEVAAQRAKHIAAAAADSLLAAADDLIGKLYSNKPPSQADTATALTALRNQVNGYRASGAIDNAGVANSLLVKLDKADAANQGKTGELKATTYDYDKNGNRIGLAWPGPQGPKTQGTNYAYNFENLLTQALDYQANTQGKRVDRAVTTMRYDGLNRRLAKTYDPKTGASGIKRTEYAFDDLDPVAEYQMWNGQYNNYYRGDRGGLLAMQNFPSGQRYTYHTDGLGSVSALTKAQGQSVHSYRYGDYGYVYPDTGNWTDPHNGFTYTGQEYDEETGLLHFYARDYDPLRGVWEQQDPYRGMLRSPKTLHRSAYVGANPVNYVDAYGYSFLDDVWNAGTKAMTDAGNWVYENREVIASTATSIAVGVAGAAAIGAVCVGTAGIGCAIAAGAVVGAVSAGSGTIVGNFVAGDEWHEDVVGSMAVGAILGGGTTAIAAKLGPVVKGALSRVSGPWSASSNVGEMLANPRVEYGIKNLFWDDRAFSSVSDQYWSRSGGAAGKSLQHLWVMNSTKWVPQGIRNSGLNLLEIPVGLNSWAGGILAREWLIRGTVGALSVGSGWLGWQGGLWLSGLFGPGTSYDSLRSRYTYGKLQMTPFVGARSKASFCSPWE